MAKEEYWFNTKTKQVEVGKQSLSLDRLGPFGTFEEARDALEIISKRAQALREEDEASQQWPN
jgi:hypothetical protein